MLYFPFFFFPTRLYKPTHNILFGNQNVVMNVWILLQSLLSLKGDQFVSSRSPFLGVVPKTSASVYVFSRQSFGPLSVSIQFYHFFPIQIWMKTTQLSLTVKREKFQNSTPLNTDSGWKSLIILYHTHQLFDILPHPISSPPI